MEMRIAYVYDAVYPYVVGGFERRVWELARRMASRGHEVHVYGMKFWDGPETIHREGVLIHGICPRMRFYRDGGRSVREAVVFAAFCLFPMLAEKFDIIDCQEFPYLHCFVVRAASGFRRGNLVVTWAEIWGTYWFEYLGRAGCFGIALEKAVSGLKACHIAMSETTRGDLEALSGRKIREMIPNGIDISRIRSIPPAGAPSDIIFAGRLIREKNVDLLIRAVGRLLPENPGIRCIIIGDGPEKERLMGLAGDLGVDGSVLFTGFLKGDEEVIGHLKSSKVFVFPSTREGFGIAALEAMACGLPVVTPDHPRNAARSFVTAETGYRSSLTDESLAEGIRVCLAGAVSMKSRCISYAEAYDWDVIADLAEDRYRKIVSRRRR